MKYVVAACTSDSYTPCIRSSSNLVAAIVAVGSLSVPAEVPWITLCPLLELVGTVVDAGVRFVVLGVQVNLEV